MKKDQASHVALRRFLGISSPPAAYERIGFWGWVGLYATGIVLICFLVSHVWLVHYGKAETITAKSTTLTLQSPLVMTIELGLLIFGVIHGLLGVKRITLDMELLKQRGSKYLTIFLIGIGAVLIFSGIILFYRLSSFTNV